MQILSRSAINVLLTGICGMEPSKLYKYKDYHFQMQLIDMLYSASIIAFRY
jgi:hypothetical protein